MTIDALPEALDKGASANKAFLARGATTVAVSADDRYDKFSWRPKRPVRLAGGWLLMLICSERKVLLVGW
jgi:hypothetical protein